jgi:hypothetical protein
MKNQTPTAAIWMWCACVWATTSTFAAELASGVDARDLPCAAQSPELADAKRRLDALDKQIRGLKPGDGHAAANEALIALSTHRCMAHSRVDSSQLRAEAAPALMDFWDSGGRRWIESHLNLASQRTVEFPPLMRKVISTETRPDHPAVELLCSLKDESCGRETGGWWQRAEAYFRLKAAPLARINQDPMGIGPGARLTENDCKNEAEAVAFAERFAFWERCVTRMRSHGFAMPLGRMKPPASGWLVVRGRRGHYTYCDELRLYSLSNGDSYISQSCSLLIQLIAGNGTPDRNRQVARGSISVDNIRELAWNLLQLQESVEGYTGVNPFSVPSSVQPMRGSDNPFLSGPPRTLMTVSSSQTTLAWALVGTAGEHLASGTLRWPGDYLGGPNDHAVGLLQIAEGGFVNGCPTMMPPENLDFGNANPVVSALDASPTELSRARRDLSTDLYTTARSECRIQR